MSPDALDFRRVILTDKIAGALREQARTEGLLKSNNPEREPVRYSDELCQRALSYIVLFDELILTSSFAGEDRRETSRWTVPLLEDAGIATAVSVNASLPVPRPGRRGSRADMLRPIHYVRPFLLNRLCREGAIDPIPKYAAVLADGFGLTEKTTYSAMLDYAVAMRERHASEACEAVASRYGIDEGVLELIFTPARQIREEEGLKDPSDEEEGWDSVEAFTLMMALSAQGFRKLLLLSIERQAGIASDSYSGTSEGWHPLTESALKAARGFSLLRCALHTEGTYLPRIDGIRHALHLRSDPNLKAVKELRRLFHHHTASGDRAAMKELAAEIRRARQRLRWARRGGTALDWVTYFSLPVAAIDALAGRPILGVSLAAIGTIGKLTIRRIEEKSKWALFGS